MSTVSNQETVNLVTQTIQNIIVTEDPSVDVVTVADPHAVAAIDQLVDTVTVTEKSTVVETLELVHVVEAGLFGVPGESWQESFETISKNLTAKPYELTYSGDQLTAITYDLGGGLEVVKTFAYTGSRLTSITLSGIIPDGIATTKTLVYTGDQLTSVEYS